ncbi:hypothetical protein PSTG_03638 [Puccinia striiformis f. sp. tritici PST-78]|uniref:Uncharacterized protein n=1 Tax=Puccinia striiformis f. sp. tritici PST-78 TaxID=1165861 RepID=A0A0L0VVN4_9BASI|nr:hypothetical protein PSTG_03638 [Puccinia striiformis f. sp. tritici PST-78]
MLLTKILVALQMLHYHAVSAHPLALAKSLVKRGEEMVPPFLDKLQDLAEPATEQLQHEMQETRKKSSSPGGVCGPFGPGSCERDASGEGLCSISTMPQDVSEIVDTSNHHNFAPSEMREHDVSRIAHLDNYESKMLQKIVNNSIQRYPSSNPFVQMNTLRAILDDSKKNEVLILVQKYQKLHRRLHFGLKDFQKPPSHSPPYELTAKSFQDKIPISHPAHQKKEEIIRECQALMRKFDRTKGERLAEILIADYTTKPPYNTQFLQDYYLKMNDFLSELNNTEKGNFWDFKESYDKYSAIGSMHSMTYLQKILYGFSFGRKISQSQQGKIGYLALKRETNHIPVPENNSRKAIHRRLMIILSNFSESELDFFFNWSKYLVDKLNKDNKMTLLFNYIKHCRIFGKGIK